MMRGRWAFVTVLAAGCGVDLSAPRATVRAPMAGAVMSSRNVRLVWDAVNPGDAPLCVNVFARRADAAPATRLRAAPRATELLLRAGDLPAAPTFFWNVADCAAPPPAERWQVTVPRTSSDDEAVAVGVSTDIDGDARPDLFYPRLQGAGRRVLADAASSLWRGTIYAVSRAPSAADRPVAFRPAGDVDGDGYADMVVLDGGLSVIFGGPYNELTDPVTLLREVAPDTQVVAGYDLDGDGRAEVATLSARGLTTLRLEGRGRLVEVGAEAVPFGGEAVVDARWVSDHDGDGAPELAVITRGAIGHAWIRWSAARETDRWVRFGDDLAARPLQRVGDVDGDERDDLGWIGESGRLVVCAGATLDRCEVMGERVLAAGAIVLPGATERTPVTLSLARSGRVELTVHERAPGGRRARVIAELTRDDPRVLPEVHVVDDDGDGQADLFVRVAAGAVSRFVAREDAAPEPEPVEGRAASGDPARRAPKPVTFEERPAAPTEDGDPDGTSTAKFTTALAGDANLKVP